MVALSRRQAATVLLGPVFGVCTHVAYRFVGELLAVAVLFCVST